MPIGYWDRAGTYMDDVLEWARLYEDPGYRFVALDVDGDTRVSTIWQGLNLQPTFIEDAIPLIFETMVFHGENEVARMFWPTEESALAGHNQTCRRFLRRRARPQDGYLNRAIEGQKRR